MGLTVLDTKTAVEKLNENDPNLVELGLSIDADHPFDRTIFDALVNNKYVTSLDLTHPGLTTHERNEFLSLVLKGKTSIKTLTLNNHKLNHQSIEIIEAHLPNNKTLNELNLSGCLDNAEHTLKVIEAAEKNTWLARMDLSHCKFGDNVGVALASLVCNSKSMGGLKLNHASLTENTIQQLAISLTTTYNSDNPSFASTKTFDLDLSSNHVTVETCKKLYTALRYNKRLHSLCLANTGMNDEGVKHIAEGLVGNKLLKKLDLSENADITDTGAQHILDLLKKNKFIIKLEFNCPNVSEDMQIKLHNQLNENFVKITYLAGSFSLFWPEAKDGNEKVGRSQLEYTGNKKLS